MDLETGGIGNAFGMTARDYDGERRALVPCFDDLYGALGECARYPSGKPSVIDIGAGTGLAAAAVRGHHHGGSYTLVDISGEMLDEARARFSGFPEFTFVTADYRAALPGGPFDVAVSALSIHHLDDDEKISLYERIYAALAPGGIFVNADQFRAPTAGLEERYMARWMRIIDCSGLPPERIRAAKARMAYDRPATIAENISWLTDAGFTDVDAPYRSFVFGVLFARKPQGRS